MRIVGAPVLCVFLFIAFAGEFYLDTITLYSINIILENYTFCYKKFSYFYQLRYGLGNANSKVFAGSLDVCTT